MKFLLKAVIVSGLVALSACVPDTGQQAEQTVEAPPSAVPAELRIDPTSVGGIALGTSLDSLTAHFGSARLRGHSGRDPDQPPGQARLEVIDPEGRTEFELILDEAGAVERIRVLVPRYNTVKGLGVGSTLAELIAAYPALTLERNTLGIWAVDGDSGLRFALDATDLTPEQASVETLSQLPSGLIVFVVELGG